MTFTAVALTIFSTITVQDFCFLVIKHSFI